jgi:hypothetical protein
MTVPLLFIVFSKTSKTFNFFSGLLKGAMDIKKWVSD